MKQSDFKRRLREIERADKRHLAMCTVELAIRLVQDFPDRGRAWFELGTAMYSVARYDEALSALRRALRLCPPEKRPIVYGHFGHLYERKGEFRRAEVSYRKVMAGNPRNADYPIFLGALLAVSGGLEEAEAVHRKATRCPEGCIDEAYLNLGLVLRAQQRYTEARRCFQKALQVSPGYKEAIKELEDMEQVLILRKKTGKPKRVTKR